MNYLEIKKNLYLVEKTIDVGTDLPDTPDPTNHIWIYDRSYSMSRELKYLTEDLINKSKEIPLGDTISLGWFSGEGDFNFILKGFKVTSESDFEILEKAVRKNNSPVSCTCFSEILGDTDKVIKDLSIISTRFSLMFMTDGYPIVSNYSREIENIFTAIENIEGSLTSSLLVGYGNYYNKELMADMSERLGGSLIHESDLREFSISLQDFIESSSDSLPKLKVDMSDFKVEEGLIFSIPNSGMINVYKLKEDNSIGYLPQTKEGFDSSQLNKLYFLTDKVLPSMEEMTLSENDVLRPNKKSSMVSAVYGLAYLLSQRTKTDLALETLSKVGDTAFLDKLVNSYTNAEYGIVENNLLEAVTSKNSRLVEGFNHNYLPKSDAFCLLDLLEILMTDSKAYFYPYNPNFKYNKIGSSYKKSGDYPEFKPDKNVKCSFSSLTWHKEFLNLSLRAQITGSVRLKKGYKELGLNRDYPTSIYRNYTLVKDGNLNMKTLPISLSRESFDKIQENGLLKDYSYEEGHIYDLPLSTIPVMNRATAEGSKSALNLAEKVIEQAKLEASLKVFRDKKKKIESQETMLVPDEQLEFLEQHGISNFIYSPKMEKVKSGDVYHAKKFSITIKGCASLPKVSDVQNKIEAGKSLTPRENLMLEAITLLRDNKFDTLPLTAQEAWIKDILNNHTKKLVKVRSEIQKTKFAILLGKQWFDEFDTRDDASVEVDGYTVNFKVSLAEVAI